MTGAAVTGIDLTPEFIETARVLSDRVGLADRLEFLSTAGESPPSTTDRSTRPSWFTSA